MYIYDVYIGPDQIPDPLTGGKSGTVGLGSTGVGVGDGRAGLGGGGTSGTGGAYLGATAGARAYGTWVGLKRRCVH